MLFLTYGGKMKLSTKLKNLEIKPIYVVFAVIAAVIFRFWGESSVTMLQKEVQNADTTEFSEDEFYRYLNVKQAFIQENYHLDWEWALRSDFEETLDKDIHEWFLVRNWHPARFVYVQYRIKDTLKYILQREEKLREADELDRQAIQFEKISKSNPQNEIAEQQAAQLHQRAEEIRYYQDREIRYAGITPKEETVVLQNRQILEQIINQ